MIVQPFVLPVLVIKRYAKDLRMFKPDGASVHVPHFYACMCTFECFCTFLNHGHFQKHLMVLANLTRIE